MSKLLSFSLKHSQAIVLSLLFVFSLSLSAQADFSGVASQAANPEADYNAGNHSAIQQTPLLTSAGDQAASQKWQFHLSSRAVREHGHGRLDSIKAFKTALKLASVSPVMDDQSQKKASAAVPFVGTNFEGNWSVLSHPPDNSIAISNAGRIVSVNNDGVEYYNTSGSLLFTENWSDFINDPSLTAMIYDPVIQYDSQEDRFVMAVLHGFTSATSQVLVLFSKSNNPSDGWNVYKLSGNPLNQGTWFDYPKIGVSAQEVYVTGNLYDNNENFNQSIIYQIEKAQGYSGGNLNWQYWFNLSSSPFPAFTLVPTSYGHQGAVGPGMLFVSSESGGQNKIRLWQITDYMSQNPSLNSFVSNVTAYSPAGDALMPNTSLTLDNSDCRILTAFFLDGKVHYVFNTDVGQGWNGIHYNRMDVNTLNNQTATLGKPGVEDYAFPTVASLSNNPSNPSVVISFLHSSSQVYPSTSVVHCNTNMQWSQPVLIKAGTNYVDFLQGNKQRWGDYNGMSRKHNASSPEVWSATHFATDIVATGGTLPNTYKTWIAQITGNSIGLEEMEDSRATSLVYPNPIENVMHLDLDLDERREVRIEIRDVQDKLVKLLYQDRPRATENHFSFSTQPLSSGIYFVIITDNQNILHREKIIIR